MSARGRPRATGCVSACGAMARGGAGAGVDGRWLMAVATSPNPRAASSHRRSSFGITRAARTARKVGALPSGVPSRARPAIAVHRIAPDHPAGWPALDDAGSGATSAGRAKARNGSTRAPPVLASCDANLRPPDPARRGRTRATRNHVARPGDRDSRTTILAHPAAAAVLHAATGAADDLMPLRQMAARGPPCRHIAAGPARLAAARWHPPACRPAAQR
jgi:hypothetical protein